MVLLHRPPTLPPKLAKTLFNLIANNHTDDSSGLQIVERLFHPGTAVPEAAVGGLRLVTLANISLFVFPVSRRSMDQSGLSSFWRPELVELALDSWARVQDVLSGSLRILYHGVHLRLHTKIGLLQHIAMAKAHSGMSSEANGRNDDDLRAWVASSDYTVSKWHAGAMLAESKRLSPGTHDSAPTGEGAIGTGSSELDSLEAPHVAYCIYYATLVLWAGSVYTQDWTSVPEIHLHAGATILAKMRVRVSGLLAKALREIIT